VLETVEGVVAEEAPRAAGSGVAMTAPVIAGPQRSTARPHTPANHATSPTGDATDRWKAWDGTTPSPMSATRRGIP